MLQSTLSGILIQNKTIEKWNGTLPQVTGGAMPMLDLNSSRTPPSRTRSRRLPSIARAMAMPRYCPSMYFGIILIYNQIRS